MKKIMLSSMILLPLILLLVLSVSTAVVGMTTFIYVESIEIVDSDETLYLYKEGLDDIPTYELKINIFPMRASNRKFICFSENEDIVKVDDKGIVSGIGFGETYIKVASDENNNKYALRKVVVTDDKVHDIKVETINTEMKIGEQQRIVYSVIPELAYDKSVSFMSSNTSILEVTLSGLIIAHSSGDATITITSISNPSVKKEINITVIDKLSDVVMNGDVSKEILNNNSAQFPEFVTTPANAKIDVKYMSSNENIATVDNQGVITFNQVGSVFITAVVNDKYTFEKEFCFLNGLIDSVNIVCEDSYEFDELLSNKLDINVITTPTKIDNKNIEIESLNKDIIDIDTNGNFYAVGGGKATIKVTYKCLNNEVKTIAKTITINKKVTSIKITDGKRTGELFFTNNKEFKIQPLVSPIDYTYQIVYSSNSKDIEIQNDIIRFNNKDYIEATINYQTNNGQLLGQFKVVYYGETIEAVKVNKGNNNIDLNMPKNIYDQKVNVLFMVDEDIQSLSINENKDALLVTVNEIGQYDYEVLLNEEDYATVHLNVKRQVESIENIQLFANFNKPEKISNNNGIYFTEAKEITILYDLYPLNTTNKVVSFSILSGNAIIEGNTINIEKIGEVKILMEVDDIREEFIIYSTFLHPSEGTETVNELTLNVGEFVTKDKLISNLYPKHSNIDYIKLESNSKILEKTYDGYKTLHGGDAELNITIDTDKGVISRNSIIHILEEPTSLIINNNYYLVECNSYVIKNDDYSILPSTANCKNNISYSSTNPNVKINNGKVMYNDGGIVKVTMTLSNGVTNTLELLFKGSNKVLDFESNAVQEINVGDKFVAKLPLSTREKYNGIDASKLVNLTYDNGIFTVLSATKDKNIPNASFMVEDDIYRIKGINPQTNIQLVPKNETEFDLVDDMLVTGLNSIDIVPIINEDATYKNINYKLDDNSVAELIENAEGCTVNFKKAGIVTIYGISPYNENVHCTLKLRSTLGVAENVYVNINNITLNYNSNKSIDLINEIKLFPSSLNVLDHVKLSANNDKLIIDKLKVSAAKGGNCYLYVEVKQKDLSYKNTKIINVLIERDSEDIIVNGQSYTNNQEITVEDGYIKLDGKTLPEDANLNTNVKITLLDETNAELTENYLVFKKQNELVPVEFSLENGITKTLYYKSIGDLSKEIDVDKSLIVVPYELPVKFKSTNNSIFEVPAQYFTEQSGLYKAKSSGTFDLKVGDELHRVVITKRVNIVDKLFVKDYINNINDYGQIDIKENNFKTASKSLELGADIEAYNKYGNKVKTEFSLVDGTIGTLLNNILCFNKAGKAKIKLSVNDEDYFGAFNYEYIFEIESTYGMAIDFIVDAPKNLVDTFEFTLQDKITTISPQYGAKDIKYLFEVDEKVEIVNDKFIVKQSGECNINVITTNGQFSNGKNVKIKIDKTIDDINFIDSNNRNIFVDYVNTNNYTIGLEIIGNNGLKPTINDLVFSIVEGNGILDGNKIKFNSDYGITKVKVTSSKINKTLLIVHVPTNVEIIEITGDNDFTVNNIDYYALDIVSKELVDINVIKENTTIINAEIGVFKFNHGGICKYSLYGHNTSFKVLETVDEIRVVSDETLTAKQEINLDELLKPEIIPSTAYDEKGAISVKYMIQNGDGTIDGNILKFNKKGVILISIIAGNISKTVSIESTFGYVKTAKFNFDQLEQDYNNGSYIIPSSAFTIYPSDVNANKYLFVGDEKYVSIKNNQITFLSGAITKLVLKFETSMNVYEEVSVPLLIHKNVSGINVLYNNKIVNRIVTTSDTYKLDYEVLDEFASPYKLTFIGDDNAVIDDNGNITFKKFNNNSSITLSKITLRVVNSNKSELEKTIDVVYTKNKIIAIDDTTIDGSSIILEKGESYYLYGVPIDEKQTSYNILSNSNLIKVNENNVLNTINGGVVAIEFTNENYTKNINLCIHAKTTNLVLNGHDNTDILTSKTTLPLSVELYPKDSNIQNVPNLNKKIVYKVQTQEGTFIEINELKFDIDNEIYKLVIDVVYDGQVEYTKTYNITSTLGKLSEIIIIDEFGNKVDTITFEDINQTNKYSVKTLPSDYNVNTLAVYANEKILNTKVIGNTFTLTSLSPYLGGSAEHIEVVVDGQTKTIDYTVCEKIKEIKIKLEGKYVVNGNTYVTTQSVIEYNVEIKETATNKNLNWIINNKPILISNNKINLKQIDDSCDSYDILIKSEDGGANIRFTIKLVNKIDSFTLTNKGNRYSSSNTTAINEKLPFNASNIVFGIEDLPENLVGNIDNSLLSFDKVGNINYEFKGNEIKIIIPVFTEQNPSFDGNCTIGFGGEKITVNIFRDGIKAIELVGHDNRTDCLHGLQEARVFAKQSYYDGAIQNVYRLPIKILPQGNNATPIFTSSDNKVTITYSNGVAYLDFTKCVANTIDEIENNIFTKFVKITATDNANTIKAEYSFTLVEGAVNVFDEAGFIACNPLVLHNNLGGSASDEASEPFEYNQNIGNMYKTIIGNGKTINFHAYNDVCTGTSKDDYKSYQVNLDRAINVNLYGSSDKQNKSTFHLTFRANKILYSRLQQLYQGLFLVDNNKVKNCLFRYINKCAIQLRSDSQHVYLENLIFVDVGYTAIDSQANALYLKGFIDAYNFKDKKGLAEISHGIGTGAIINELNSKYPSYLQKIDNVIYINSVIFCNKGKTHKEIKVYFWDGKQYIESDTGNSYTCPGLARLRANNIFMANAGDLMTYMVDDKYNKENMDNPDYIKLQENRLKRTAM